MKKLGMLLILIFICSFLLIGCGGSNPPLVTHHYTISLQFGSANDIENSGISANGYTDPSNIVIPSSSWFVNKKENDGWGGYDHILFNMNYSFCSVVVRDELGNLVPDGDLWGNIIWESPDFDKVVVTSPITDPLLTFNTIQTGVMHFTARYMDASATGTIVVMHKNEIKFDGSQGFDFENLLIVNNPNTSNADMWYENIGGIKYIHAVNGTSVILGNGDGNNLTYIMGTPYRVPDEQNLIYSNSIPCVQRGTFILKTRNNKFVKIFSLPGPYTTTTNVRFYYEVSDTPDFSLHYDL